MSYLVADNTYKVLDLTVFEYCLNKIKNNPNNIDMPDILLPNGKPKFITIHNTDWIDVVSDTTPAEQYTRATRNGNMQSTRVHFYVDDVCAWQGLTLDSISWHSGDGTTNPESGNRTSISVECIMRNTTDSNSIKSMDNSAKLCAWLLHKFGLNVEEHLVTHTYWISKERGLTGDKDYLCTAIGGYKYCPYYIMSRPNGWKEFCALVNKYLGQIKNPNVIPTTKPTTTNLYRVRKSWSDVKSQLGAFSNLENAKNICIEGYSVFDSNGNAVYTKTAPTKVSKWDFEYDVDIVALQKILNNKGARLSVDGVSGDNTYNECKKYTIENGDSGELTRWIQNRLNKLGYDCGVADGIVGQNTMNGIAKFQKANGLGVGYLGGTDWYYLIK